MNLQELAAKVNLDTEIVANHIAPFRIRVEDIDWKALQVPAGQSVTIDADDPAFQHQIKRMRPQQLEDVREWAGIPARSYTRRVVAGRVIPAMRPSATLTARLASSDLHSISPTARLADLQPMQRTKMIGAAKNLVFGQVKTAELNTPLYAAAQAWIMERVLPIFFASDIVVGPNASLYISPSVSSIVAYRIRIHRGGSIITPRYSYVSFHCYSVEGGIV